MMKIVSKEEIEESKKVMPWIRENMDVDEICPYLAEDAPDDVKAIYARWKAEKRNLIKI